MELKKYKLGDVADIVNGATPSTHNSENYDGSIIWITPKDLSGQKQKIIRRGQRNISEIGFNNCSAQMIPPYNILMSSRAPIGLLAINENECCTNQGFKNLVLDKSICDTDYMYYYLQFHMKEIEALGSGTTFKEISKSALQGIEIRLPDLEKQRDIAKCLSDLDRKIELNKQINDNLEAMAKQLYDYWFVQFDFPNEEGKPYKSSGGAMVWNEKLKREIPQGWYCGTLLDIAEYTNGLACQKYRPTDNNKLPVIKIKEMHDGLSADTEWVKTDIPDDVKVFDGDVLFSWSASLEVMLWAYGNGGLNQHIFKVTSKNGYPRSFYFYQLIHYVGIFKQMAEARKTTMGHITQDHLKQSTIALPPNVDIANKLEEKLCPIFDEIVKNNQEIIVLTKQRDELLPLLMNSQASINYHLSVFYTKR